MAILKSYNGSSWDEPVVKLYNTSWLTPLPKFYDGTSWIDLASTNPVLLDGAALTVFQDNFGGTCYAGVNFEEDGGTERMGFTSTFLNPYVDWHEDADATTGGNYDIRLLSLVSGTYTNNAAGVGTWVSLSAARYWRNSVNSKFSPSTKDTTGNFQIRDASTLEILADFTMRAKADN